MSKDEKLKAALKRLEDKGVDKLMKKDLDELYEFIRPNHMATGRFKDEVNDRIQKWISKSNEDDYDEYESQVIKNTTGKFYEFMLVAYRTMAR